MVIDDSKSHVMPKVINTLSNAIASTFNLPSISVINQPFKGESFDAGFDGGLFAGAMFFGFTYVFLVMQQGMELIYDREVHKSVLPTSDIFWHEYASLDGSIFTFRLRPKTNLESMVLGFIYILVQCTL